jgi:DNA-binding IclR family transcriptional regulator
LINSIYRGAEILKTIYSGVNRLTDISYSLKLNKSTTHRLLKALEKSGLVIQDSLTRKYLPGHLILRLASNPIFSHQFLIVASHGEMSHLRDLTKESVALHIAIGSQRICLSEIQSNQDIVYISGVGQLAPVYVGSAGKILLSEMRREEMELLLNGIKLLPIGPKTIIEKKKLLKEIEKIRILGYATSHEERLYGGVSISVPIKNYVCPVSLSILAPYFRFGSKMINFLDDLKASAIRISENIKEHIISPSLGSG